MDELSLESEVFRPQQTAALNWVLQKRAAIAKHAIISLYRHAVG